MSNQKSSSSFERMLATPIGFVYGFASLILLIGLPIQAFVRGASLEQSVGMALIAFVIAGIVVLIAGLGVTIFVRLGPLLAAVQAVFVIKALSDGNGSSAHIHLDLWCQIVQALGIHNTTFEYICAAVVIFGWLQLADR